MFYPNIPNIPKIKMAVEAGPASPYVYIADVAEDGVFRSPRVPLVIPTKKGHLPYQEIPETVTKNIQN